MLLRHIIGYTPATLVPALAAFAAAYSFTRLLSPAEFGYYALATSTISFLLVFFVWLQIALTRLAPSADKAGELRPLQVTSYFSFAAISLGLTLGYWVARLLFPSLSLALLPWLALPIALSRALLNVGLAFHRSALNFGRYNVVECGQAAFGLALGLALTGLLGMGYRGVLLGQLGGLLAMAFVDLNLLRHLRYREFDWPALRGLFHYGSSLTIAYLFAMVLSVSDRYFIAYFQGAGAVGLYGAGYVVVDRILGFVFTLIALPAFPLAVRKLEIEGVEAAKSQIARNGVALLMTVLPACAGLILVSEPLAQVFIGESFRSGALRVMPWIAAAGLFNGLSTHFFDHACYFAKKPQLTLCAKAPAAAANIALNLLLIPRFGYIGAAYATLASYFMLCVGAWALSARVFPLPVRVGDALKVALAVMGMSAALLVIRFPPRWLGLISMVVVGGAVYSGFILALNVMDARAVVSRIARRTLRRLASP